MMDLTLFELDTTRPAVMTRTALIERKHRERIDALDSLYWRLRTKRMDEHAELDRRLRVKREELEELTTTINGLMSTEPLKTIKAMEQKINALGGCVRQAKDDAAYAQRSADDARSAVAREARKDFWDRI